MGASSARLVAQFVTEGVVLWSRGQPPRPGRRPMGDAATHRAHPREHAGGHALPADLGLNAASCLRGGDHALLAAALFSITPALRLSSPGIREGLAEGSRGSAGSLGAGSAPSSWCSSWPWPWCCSSARAFSAKSLYRLLQVDLGFRPERLVTRDRGAGPEYGKAEQPSLWRATSEPRPGPPRRPVGRNRDQRPPPRQQRQHDLVQGLGPALARRAQRVPRTGREPGLLHDARGHAVGAGAFSPRRTTCRSPRWRSSTRPWPRSISRAKMPSASSSPTSRIPPCPWRSSGS